MIARYVQGLAMYYAELSDRQLCNKYSALLYMHFLQPTANSQDRHV
ncbi:hypothetical protein AZ54_17525 [Xanthomonas oryzae pv. oryzae PXO86]|nr:hypothetical protein AZ54_17525 [Xanthomonas oryzae pv. oryzae PXO86]